MLCRTTGLYENRHRMTLNKHVRVVFGTPADAGLTNAQCINGREIGSRLHSGFDVTFFYWQDPDPRLVQRPGTRLIRLGAHGNALRMIREVLSGHDVFFNIDCGPAEALLRPILRVMSRPATVFQVETRLPIPDWIRVPARHLRGMNAWIRQASIVTGVSHEIVRHLRQDSGRLDATRVPVGVDVAASAPGKRQINRRRPMVLTAGTLQLRKRPGKVVEAARRFPHADFLLVGDGPLRFDLESEVVAGGLGNVRFLGTLPNDEVLQRMGEADVFFFPSVHEGQPRVVLEAAASGLPVVSRNDYGPEGVLPGISGFAAASDEEMFEGLGTLLESATLRTQMGEAGRAHAKAFDWSRIVPIWAEMFEKLSA